MLMFQGIHYSQWYYPNLQLELVEMGRASFTACFMIWNAHFLSNLFYVKFHTFFFVLLIRDSLKPKTCPGPPAALPPKLEDYEMDPDEGEGQQAPRESSVRFDKTASSSAPAKSSLDPAQQIQLKMVALAGQDIDLYMKKVSI